MERATRDAFWAGLLLGVLFCWVVTAMTPDPVRVVVVTQKVKVTWASGPPEPQKPKAEAPESPG